MNCVTVQGVRQLCDNVRHFRGLCSSDEIGVFRAREFVISKNGVNIKNFKVM